MSISEYLDSIGLHFKNQDSESGTSSSQKSGELPNSFITISRLAGAGGISVGNKITELLNNNKKLSWPCPWTVFDKNLINTVIEEHNLPEKFKKYMTESNISQIDDILGEFLGLHPSSIALVHRTNETILHLAQIGNAVIVGRGSGIITRRLKGGFHVHLVGSLEKRVQRVMEYSKVTCAQAKDLIAKWDKGRKKYFKDYFNKDNEDALLFDLTINTDNVSYDNTAKIITHSMLYSQGII